MNGILLSKCIIHICHFFAAWNLIVWRERVGGTDGYGGLFEGVWLGTEDVLGVISNLNFTSLSRMEVSKSLSTNGTSVDVTGLEGGGEEVLILTGLGEHLWLASLHLSNLTLITLIVSYDV